MEQQKRPTATMEEVVRWARAALQKKNKNAAELIHGDDSDEAAALLRCRKTKIVCTLGPRTRDVATLERLLRAGMNVARFNFSHGSHDYHRHTLDNLRAAMHNTQLMCAVMLDTKGPEIRTGLLKDGKAVQLREGQEITIYAAGDEEVPASSSPPPKEKDGSTTLTCISISYKQLATAVAPGSTILCADGSITLKVLSCDAVRRTVRCRCENTAVLGEKKNVNLPGVVVDLPTFTDKDRDDILNWAMPNRIDFIAASFVRKADDVLRLRQLLGPHARSIQIISKIENQEGLVNFEDILRETDGIMVARGDLGMEIPTEKVFLAQKMMIYKCNAAGKPVVTATQMLESMIKSRRPSRAEATDVANAVLDGTDAVMLSGETAAGEYPEEAVKVMARLCVEAEAAMDHGQIMKQRMRSADVTDGAGPLESLACAAVRAAWTVRAALIMVLTRTGVTAALVAKYRPHVPIVSVVVPVITTDRLTWSLGEECPYRHTLICRGLIPILAEASTHGKDCDASDEILSSAIEQVLELGLCRRGDALVALHRIGASSVIKIVDIKQLGSSMEKPTNNGPHSP